ncbi:MAG: cytochrome-c peroxidase [Lewinellaceae bacterium]|nr:cytochrome-c peroxidase [Lewinellaceae bacterium]
MKVFTLPGFALTSMLGLTLTLASCNSEESVTQTTILDEDLRNTVAAAAPGGVGLSYFKLPESTDFSAIPQDPRNPLTAFKVQLGQMLFHETALGRNPMNPSGFQTYSCASCHHADGGFQACLAQGIGEGGLGFGQHGEGRSLNPNYANEIVDVQPIRTPSAMNSAWQIVQLWNGQFGALGMNVGTEASWTPGTPKENNNFGYEGVETQAIAGINVHRMIVDKDWVESYPMYKAMFDAAFPDVPVTDRYNRITAGLAIAAFERTIIANQSPWQRWLRGNEAVLSDLEKEGAALFFGKADCSSCHTGPALNSMAFYGYGMGNLENGSYGAINITADKPEHKGRGGFTGRPEDNYKFKVPQLYNLKDSPFYGHGATFTSVRDVVAYKNQGVAQNAQVPGTQLANQFKPLGLSEQEVDAITAFLENALYDPNLHRYVPTNLPSGNCIPNNDTKSKADRGCN